jgi:phasin
MASGPRKTSKTAATVDEAPESAPVAEPAAAIAEPLQAIVEAVQAVAAETAQAFDASKAVEASKAFEPAKADEVVAEVARVQQAAKDAAVETAHALEDSFTAASKSLQAFSAKALEAYQANAHASVTYLQALSGVRSVSEAIALQSEHMRKQYETLTAQAKELTALAQQVAADAAGPFKDQIGKTFKPN